MGKTKHARLRKPPDEKLAGMIHRSFEAERRATAREFAVLTEKMDAGFAAVLKETRQANERLTEVWSAVNRIEKDVLAEHARRIERLEANPGL